MSAPEGWAGTVAETLEHVGLTLVAAPVSTENWAAIRAALKADAEPQGRVFECVGATQPSTLPVLVRDWNAMVIGIGRRLVSAGLPRDEIATALDAVDANQLWHRPDPRALPQLRKDCEADPS